MESWKADEKQMRWSKVRRKKMQERESQKKEDATARNVREVAKCCVFSMIRVSGQSKSRLDTTTPTQKHHHKNTTTQTARQKHHHTTTKTPPHHHKNTTTKTPPQKHRHKNTTAQTPPQKHHRTNTTTKTPPHHHKNTLFVVPMSKNCTPLWREAHFQVKMYKTPQLRSTFATSSVEAFNPAVARSTFASENVKRLTVLEHFLKFRRRKIARRCGEKHVCKSKCTKYQCFGTMFEVQMSKN